MVNPVYFTDMLKIYNVFIYT